MCCWKNRSTYRASERAARSVPDGKPGRKLAIMLQHRFRTASLELAKAVRAGELGPLVSGSASIRWWRTPEYFAQPGRGMKARDGGGVLITQAIHTLDLFQSLAGPITMVAAFAKTSPLRKIDTEDIVGAGIAFANGAVGTIDATTVGLSRLSGAHRTRRREGDGRACRRDARFLFQGWPPHASRRRRLQKRRRRSDGLPQRRTQGADRRLLGRYRSKPRPHHQRSEALKVQLLIEALLRSAKEGKAIDVPTA
jgi:predicted dehydrogenase